MLKNTFQKFIDIYLRKMRKWEKKHPLINTLVVSIGVILLWRGIWGLCDTYIFPENPLLSNILTIVIGLVILLIDDFELDEL